MQVCSRAVISPAVPPARICVSSSYAAITTLLALKNLVLSRVAFIILFTSAIYLYYRSDSDFMGKRKRQTADDA